MGVLLRATAASLMFALGGSSAWAAAQSIVPRTAGQGTRDSVPSARAGTGVVKGRVIDGLSGTALARARVRLLGQGGAHPAATTDGEGWFTYTGLGAGMFTVVVEKATYQTGQYPEPGRTLRGSSRPLFLRPGETRDDIVVRLYRGAAITGRVVDAYGDPVDFAEVRALRVAPGTGAPQARGGGGTNDIGEFRVARLEPGTYVLLAVPRRQPTFEDNPRERSVTPQTAPPQPVPTYFPSTPILDQSQRIVVQRGQTVSGIEIVLGEGIPAVVTGTVVQRDGQAVASGSVMARSVLRESGGGFDGGGTGIRPDGTFRLQLPPGEYQLEASVAPPPQLSVPTRPENESFGSIRLTVGEGLTEGVSIVVGRSATATGRIVFDGAGQPPPNAGQVRIMVFMPTESGSCRPGQAVIAADWTFHIEGLLGTCFTAPPTGVDRWIVKAVLHNGEDISYRPITFEPGQQIRGLQVVLTDKATELNVHVSDETGQATRDYVVLLFSVDKNRWTPGSRQLRTYVPPSDEILALRNSMADQTSQAVPGRPPQPVNTHREYVGGLIAGEYYAIALDDLDRELLRDPTILERLSTAATRVTVAEGGVADVALQRLKAEDVLR